MNFFNLFQADDTNLGDSYHQNETKNSLKLKQYENEICTHKKYGLQIMLCICLHDAIMKLKIILIFPFCSSRVFFVYFLW